MQIQKPDYTCSIVTVKANETIPETFLYKLLSENRTAIGFVVQDKKLEVEKFTPLGTVEEEMVNITGILDNTKKFNRMFCFQAFPPEYDEDEVQPWTIIKDSKGNPLLVVCLEGDLPGRDVDGSSEMLGTINEYLGPKIEALFTLIGNDPKKLYAALKDQKGFGADLMNVIGHRGIFAFMPVEGEIFAHGKNELGGAFSWGSASLAYGYTEAAIEAATPAKVAEPAAAPRKVSKYASAEPTPAPGVDKNGIHHITEKPVEVPKVTPQPETDPVKKAADAAIEGHWETPPANIHGKKLKLWYRQMDASNKGIPVTDGDLTGDWNKRPRVWVKHQTTVKALADLDKTAVSANALKADIGVAPVISGDQQAKINEFIKKYLDGSSNVITNPLELQKQEAKLPLFSELCLKGGLAEINTWPNAMIAAFCKSYPEGSHLLVTELRRRVINLEASLAAGNKTLGELTGTEKTITEEPASPALTPSLEPALQPVHKKSKYA